VVSGLQDPFKQLQRFPQHIRRAAQGDMKLLHSFPPTTFLLQCLKFAVLLVENDLFGIKHQAIGRTHKSTSMQDDFCARYQSIFHRRKSTLSAVPNTFGEPRTPAALR
jgi:hypothetical protein